MYVEVNDGHKRPLLFCIFTIFRYHQSCFVPHFSPSALHLLFSTHLHKTFYTLLKRSTIAHVVIFFRLLNFSKIAPFQFWVSECELLPQKRNCQPVSPFLWGTHICRTLTAFVVDTFFRYTVYLVTCTVVIMGLLTQHFLLILNSRFCNGATMLIAFLVDYSVLLLSVWSKAMLIELESFVFGFWLRNTVSSKKTCPVQSRPRFSLFNSRWKSSSSHHFIPELDRLPCFLDLFSATLWTCAENLSFLIKSIYWEAFPINFRIGFYRCSALLR